MCMKDCDTLFLQKGIKKDSFLPGLGRWAVLLLLIEHVGAEAVVETLDFRALIVPQTT